MGRFQSPDDGSDQEVNDPQSWNLYSYARNNPLTNTDPDGHTCQTNSSDGNTYDDGDGRGCSIVDAENIVSPVVYQVTTSNPDASLQLATDVSNLTSRDSLLNVAANGFAGALTVEGIASIPGLLRDASGLIGAMRAGLTGAPAVGQALSDATIEGVVASSERAASPQISAGARALAKKAGHAASGGFNSAFDGVAPNQQAASNLIRSIMSNPASVVRGGQTVDVYNTAGQGVRFEAGTNKFIGFIEGTLRSR